MSLNYYILGAIVGILFVLTLIIVFMFAMNGKMKCREGMAQGVDPRYYKDFAKNWNWQYNNRHLFFGDDLRKE